MILPYLYISDSKNRGRGVYTSENLAVGTVIEISPVIVLPETDKILLDQTQLKDYIFLWGDEEKGCCVALGYLSVYNHSYMSNAEYEMDFSKAVMKISIMHYTRKDEEIFINYNGNWNDPKPVWFDAV